MSMDTVREIREALLTHADEGYKDFQCPLMPTVDPATVIGVRTPILRRMAKDLRGTAGREALMNDLPHTCFEENQLHAFLIESIHEFDEAVAATDTFLPYVDNWATCDQMAPKVLRTRKALLLDKIKVWLTSDHPYTVRYGMGMLMRHYLDESFDPAYLRLVSSVQSEHYYVRMMVAWYFATALAKQYETTIPYLAEGRLELWVHNKAIQKARESYRISPAQKAYLKTLKR